MPFMHLAWLRWMRLFCLFVALTIGAGIVIGQAKRIPYAKLDAEIWEPQHQDIIRMRDEGDPAVYTKTFKRTMGITRSEAYKLDSLAWYERLFYDLDYTLPENLYAPQGESGA